MNYQKCEWMIQEGKRFNWNGFYATYDATHCQTCASDGMNHYRVLAEDRTEDRTIYTRCTKCKSWWLDRRHYNRATSFKQNTIKRAMDIA